MRLDLRLDTTGRMIRIAVVRIEAQNPFRDVSLLACYIHDIEYSSMSVYAVQVQCVHHPRIIQVR